MQTTTPIPDAAETSPLRRFLEKFRPAQSELLSPNEAAYVEQLREVRRGAKQAARSGNPAKRIPAQQVVVQCGELIAATYRAAAHRAGRVTS